MTDRPIIFSAPMVQALLAGRKTQTRRLLKMPPGPIDSLFSQDGKWWTGDCLTGEKHADIKVPYAVGDRLWVRENWQTYSTLDGDAPSALTGLRVWYCADDGYKPQSKVRPSIHMPRWASRLTLAVISVKVERLQDISEEDAQAEGVYPAAVYGGQVQSWLPSVDLRETFHPMAKEAFRDLWERINGPESWEANPWVVAVTFTVHKGNIDEMEER